MLHALITWVIGTRGRGQLNDHENGAATARKMNARPNTFCCAIISKNTKKKTTNQNGKEMHDQNQITFDNRIERGMNGD